MRKTIAAVAIVAALVAALTMGSALEEKPEPQALAPFQFRNRGGVVVRKIGDQAWEIRLGPLVTWNGEDDTRKAVFTAAAWDYADRAWNLSRRYEVEGYCEIAGQRAPFPVIVGPEDEFMLVMEIHGVGTKLVSGYWIYVEFRYIVQSTKRVIGSSLDLP